MLYDLPFNACITVMRARRTYLNRRQPPGLLLTPGCADGVLDREKLNTSRQQAIEYLLDGWLGIQIF